MRVVSVHKDLTLWTNLDWCKESGKKALKLWEKPFLTSGGLNKKMNKKTNQPTDSQTSRE